MADDQADDDERSIELSTIQAIFPELITDPQDRFIACLDLAVAPSKSFPVIFPPLATVAAPPQQPTPPSSINPNHANGAPGVDVQPIVEIRYLSYLPSLRLKIALPEGYPSDAPPAIQLTSHPPWLPDSKIQELQGQAEILWEENGKNQVLYDYIDHLQQTAEDGFGLVPAGGSALVLAQELEVPLLDHDLTMKRRKFEQETFDCGVCLEPKKGLVCHRLQLCGHVFCVECLQDFYNNCITEGDISQVKCLAPTCEKEVPNLHVQGDKRKRKADRTLDPSELLQIPIGQEKVQRYVMLKKKKRLESNRKTIYCPRKWCQGPARTGKRRNSNEDSDDDDNDQIQEYDPNANQDTLPPPGERLAICEDCAFAFCSVCKTGWHGEFQDCYPRRQYELTKEEKASEEYLQAHSTSCPTCNARCQKTMGCNHMICFQCKTHFCYLCSAWLQADNPYVHFNTKWQPCYQRLWELEEGDGIDVLRPAELQGPPPPPPPEIVFEDSDDDDGGDQPPAPPPAPNPPAQAAVRQQWQWQPPPGIRVNRRVLQGLARPAAPMQQQQQQARGDGLQRFLRMAADDVEDGWDSDELDSDEGDIP